MIDVGQKLPQLELQNQDGHTKTNGTYEGKWLVLYVYPKDDTPGCTIQGQSFTASKADFDALNTTVVGLSADDVASHKAFCDKFTFTIDLLADPSEKFLKALGVGQTDWKGTLYWDRTTFLVDPKGVVAKVYTKVDPKGHDQALLTDLRQLQA